MSSKLLRNGTVLSFDDRTQSIKVLRNASVLIKGDEIVVIGEAIDAPAETEIIDVSDRIVAPGMINTHTHLWQTAYRTMGPDTTLAEYFTIASALSSAIKLFSPQDIYISCLEGYYEGLNGGVTTFLEHAHNNWEIDAVKAGWDAAVDGGARVWWCPDVVDRENCKAEEQVSFIRSVGPRTQEGHALVSSGLACDAFGASSAEQINQTKQMIKDLNLEAITMHYLGTESSWPRTNSQEYSKHSSCPLTPCVVPDTSPTAAAKAKLQELNIPIVFSHGGFLTETDKQALREHDWNISITPESEMHYGHGQVDSRFAQDQASLGIDTNWTFSGDILTQTRLWLQNVRGISYTKIVKDGFIPKENPMSVEDAFLLATRQGGRALRRDDLGVLKVGAKADIVVFNGDSPNMVGWTDPIAAIVLHASISDIESVFVGGEVRKRDGKFVLKEGEWSEFRQKFAEVARRIQGQNTERPPHGEKFWGVGEWGDVEVMTTRRQP